MGKLRHQARARPAMTKHDWLSIGIAVFAERDLFAVPANKNFVPQRNHWHIILIGLFCDDAKFVARQLPPPRAHNRSL